MRLRGMDNYGDYWIVAGYRDKRSKLVKLTTVETDARAVARTMMHEGAVVCKVYKRDPANADVSPCYTLCDIGSVTATGELREAQ